jgi:MFS family permease
MRLKIDISIKASKLVKTFVLAQVMLISGWSLIAPLFAVFILDRIDGATVVTVGIASAIYFILKSVIQIPIANHLDKTFGEKNDFYAVIIGSVLAATSAFAFILVKEVWQLYLVQAIHAIAFGIYVPGYAGMFSRHHDKDHDSLDWSLQSTAAGIGAGVTGAIGGILASAFGFDVIFILVALFSLITAFILLSVPKLIFPKGKKKPIELKEVSHHQHH